jgi:molybdopterin synthase sulfur carrier subunit
MKLKIKFLKPFSDAVDKSELEFNFNGITLNELLQVLVNRYPKLKTEFYTLNEDLSDHVCIIINDKPTSALNGLKTELKNGDEILFFVPISGG